MLATISKLQVDGEMYQLLEQVINTQVPVEIAFKGKKLLIILEKPTSDKLANLVPHPDCLVGDPEDIVHLDWSKEIHDDLP